jgi:hypothetical protein
MSSIPKFDLDFDYTRPTAKPSHDNHSPEDESLAPLAEERQVPTGLENPFWKADDR